MKQMRFSMLLTAIYIALYIVCLMVGVDIRVLFLINLAMPVILGFMVFSILIDRKQSRKTFGKHYYENY